MFSVNSSNIQKTDAYLITYTCLIFCCLIVLFRLDAIQVRALSCLDNMFSLVDVDLQCDQHVLEAIWNALFHLGFDKTGMKLLEIFTGIHSISIVSTCIFFLNYYR